MSLVPTQDTSSSSQPIERSLNGQVVLEEDEYTAALSHIIARDFFPSLVRLGATNGYLDALSSQDPHLINASVRRLEEISSTPQRAIQTPSRTPYGAGPSETPLRMQWGEAPNKRARIDTDMNLDLFQARYTSEDNSSFTQIMDDENRKRKERWAWAWDAQKRVEAQRDRMVEGRDRMLIEAPPVAGVREKFAIELPIPVGLITDGKTNAGRQKEATDEKNKDKGQEAVLRNADEEEDTPVDVMAPIKDTRSAGVDGWKFKTRNSLMFSPDADESPYHPPINMTEAGGDPKVVKYANTRLPEQEENSDLRTSSAPPSPTRSRINAAITGTPYRPRSPTINNFSLVPTLPSPTPSELGPTAVKQLMTWGTLHATPRIISQSDDHVGLPPPSTPFHLPDITSREALSHRLSSKASKSLREKAGLMGLSGITNRTPRATRAPVGSKGKQGGMGPPSWTPRRSEAAGNLTPAAKRLLERSTLGSAALKRAEGMEKAGWDDGKGKEKDLNRVRWTPTPGA